MRENEQLKATPLMFTPQMMRQILSGAKTLTSRAPRPAIKAITSPGDLIWVREHFYEKGRWDQLCDPDGGERDVFEWCSCGEVLYGADSERPDNNSKSFCWRSRPAIHMPRWASRITLTVTDLTMKPVRGFSLEDINREGIGIFSTHSEALHVWRSLWVSLNGLESWESNEPLRLIGFRAMLNNSHKH